MEASRDPDDAPKPRAAPASSRRPAPASRSGDVTHLAGTAAAALGVGLASIVTMPNSVPFDDTVGVIRGLGLGRSGAFHAYDMCAGQLLQWLPIGTPVFRAGLATALVLALAAACCASLFQRWLAPQSGKPSWRRAIIAATATWAAFFSPSIHADARTLSGGPLGCLLLVSAAWLRVREHTGESSAARPASRLASSALLGGVLGAACTHDVPTALLVALIVFWGNLPVWRSFLPAAALAFTPIAAAIIRSRIGAHSAYLDNAAGAFGDPSLTPTSLRVVGGEVGIVIVAVAAIGIAAALREAHIPRRTAFAGAGIALGAAAMLVVAQRLHARPGTAHYALMLFAYGLAAFGFERLLRWVEAMPIPAASASAGLLTVLGLAAPLRHFDSVFYTQSPWAEQTDLLFADAAFAGLPTGTLVLAGDRGFARVHGALQAASLIRSDVQLLSLFDLREALTDLEHDGGRGPSPTRAVIRDQLLRGAPTELSLSATANAGPLALVFDPTWDRDLAKHLTTAGLVMVYASEPRGSSDRRIAHEKFNAARVRLLRAVEPAAELGLRTHVVRLLRARAIAMAATGERESVSLALDELRAFSKEDPLLGELVRRVMLGRATTRVSDLKTE